MNTRRDQIIINAKAGTRAMLREIESNGGATKEDILKLGMHFYFKKLAWDKEQTEKAEKKSQGFFHRIFSGKK